jgi:Flp pilus assembly pilin Flp
MYEMIKAMLIALKSDRRGVTAVEYAIIAAVMAGAVAAAFGGLSTHLSSAINGITF